MKDQELLELCNKYLIYNPETGVFTNKISRKGGLNSNQGAELGHGRDNYIKLRLLGKKYSAHRLAFLITYNYLPPMIDHINRKKSDNRILNLRACTRSQNGINQGFRPDNMSGYKGVSYCNRNNMWTAKISYQGKEKHVGYFLCKHEAAKAYNRAALNYFGEFAYLNTPA